MIDEIFQTIEDKNRQNILRTGPFYAHGKDQWLGEGYYFWDESIEVAHWWGKVHFNNKGKDYVICRSSIEIDEKILDLISPKTMKYLRNAFSILQEESPFDNLSVAFVLQYMQKFTTMTIKYSAIRAYFVDCVGRNNDIAQYRIYKNDRSYLDLCPPVQLCLFSNRLLIDPYTMVFPNTDFNEYVG